MALIDDIRFEMMRGKGPGGQHKNKTSSCVRATHVPSGIVVVIDGRKQGQNKREAVKEIESRLAKRKREQQANAKKDRRDQAIHDETVIRTYNFSRGLVKDHRTGKTASLKDVLGKGRFDLLTQDLLVDPAYRQKLKDSGEL